MAFHSFFVPKKCPNHTFQLDLLCLPQSETCLCFQKTDYYLEVLLIIKDNTVYLHILLIEHSHTLQKIRYHKNEKKKKKKEKPIKTLKQ